MTKNLEIVNAVLAAMRMQDANRALEHVSSQFVQHSPYVADGTEGLREYIDRSQPEALKFSLVRTVEDGPFVVAQLQSDLTGEHIFAVYRFEGGLIAEHWAFSTPDTPPNKSGHTQLDGPTKPRNLADTELNKAFARRYYETFHLRGNHRKSEEFFDADVMIRHEAGVRDGLSEFLNDVQHLMMHRTIDELKLLIGQGDLVFIAAKGTHEGNEAVYIDLYRIENQKIVEHWGFPGSVPPSSERKNLNDML